MSQHPQIKIAAEVVRSRIEALKASFPDLEEDVELLAGMVEGETDFDLVLERIVKEALESEAMAEGLHEYGTNIRSRRDRLLRKGEAMRDLAMGLMNAAGKDKALLATATLTIRGGSQLVTIDSEDDLPQGFVKRTPLVSVIKNALKNGEDVPGARLTAGDPSLTIRTA